MFNPNMNTVASEATTAANTNTAKASANVSVANTNDAGGIKQSWPLLAFRKLYARMQYCPNQRNRLTGETFKSLAFTKADGTIDYVHFSRNLGVLSPEEILAQKRELQVCLLASGTYSLCRSGQNSYIDIDLGD